MGIEQLELIGGHACLDFVNTAGDHLSDQPGEWLLTYRDLLSWAHRAGLLTGRNHHSAHSGNIGELATGFPGYDGIIPKSCATIADLLSHNGYATGWWGKNHNVPDNQTSEAGPFHNWPTHMGFDYFYGFIGGETDQFYPALYRGTRAVPIPGKPEEG